MRRLTKQHLSAIVGESLRQRRASSSDHAVGLGLTPAQFRLGVEEFRDVDAERTGQAYVVDDRTHDVYSTTDILDGVGYVLRRTKRYLTGIRRVLTGTLRPLAAANPGDQRLAGLVFGLGQLAEALDFNQAQLEAAHAEAVLATRGNGTPDLAAR